MLFLVSFSLPWSRLYFVLPLSALLSSCLLWIFYVFFKDFFSSQLFSYLLSSPVLCFCPGPLVILFISFVYLLSPLVSLLASYLPCMPLVSSYPLCSLVPSLPTCLLCSYCSSMFVWPSLLSSSLLSAHLLCPRSTAFSSCLLSPLLALCSPLQYIYLASYLDLLLQLRGFVFRPYFISTACCLISACPWGGGRGGGTGLPPTWRLL